MAGKGPVYVAMTAKSSHVVYTQNRYGQSPWYGVKFLWIGAQSYNGPVLIRGRSLTSGGPVGFGQVNPPFAEMQIAPGPGWGVVGNNNLGRSWPSMERLRKPGCYGLQVDGTNFSYVIVFRAVRR